MGGVKFSFQVSGKSVVVLVTTEAKFGRPGTWSLPRSAISSDRPLTDGDYTSIEIWLTDQTGTRFSVEPM